MTSSIFAICETKMLNISFSLSKHIISKLKTIYLDKENNMFIHAIENGERNEMITKFPNMFAILYDYASDKEKQDIMEHVMLNDKIEKITTP